MQVQSVLFDINMYNITRSRQWLKQHGFKYDGKVHTTSKYHRFRQSNPDLYNKFVNKKVRDGISLVLGK